MSETTSQPLSHKEYLELRKHIEADLSARYILLSWARAMTLLALTVVGVGATSWWVSSRAAIEGLSRITADHQLDEKIALIEKVAAQAAGLEKGELTARKISIMDGEVVRAKLFFATRTEKNVGGTYLQFSDEKGRLAFQLTARNGVTPDGAASVRMHSYNPERTPSPIP